MPLTEHDRGLLLRCLGRKDGAWKEFVDYFMGLVVHVVQHTAHSRSVKLSREDSEDLCSEIFLAIVQDDFAVLRHFRGQASLATYLTVVARRICVREMLKRKWGGNPGSSMNMLAVNLVSPEERIANQEEVQKLMEGLSDPEAKVVRMYHLEGKSYNEISSAVGLPENSIGPTLSRAREKMRGLGTASA